ncbi:MAG: response regulator [Gemmatimonadetes bacterium]|nr:response regulator [Gemmatimonadota bacterium]NIR80336.1 response regulator [Gemmatimonadota bacterium]NIT89099.1 response regulator [Gemmatimonadota bacterium]NIU32896.1 response regulator [Gemmatimonadota bacterium]NIU37650.1 response regulator [Gemmatimonadota bacterium]
MANIIIIDDEDVLRLTMRKILERVGHQVRDAGNGDEGIRLHRESPAELVITDLYMPGKEGIETIQELKDAEPDLPILAVSGGSAVMNAENTLADAELLGADAILPKPFSVDQLRDAVTELVGV